MTRPLAISIAASVVMTTAAMTAQAMPPGLPAANPPLPTIVLEAGGAPRMLPITTAALGDPVDLRVVIENGAELVDARIEHAPAPDTVGTGGGATGAMLWLRACRCRGPATRSGRVEILDAAGVLVATAPFVADVRPSPWICWSPLAVGLGGCLLLGLFAGPLLRSRFLPSPQQLARTLLGMRWRNDYGAREEADDVDEMVRGILRRALRPRARVAAWLGANPLRLVWPGRLYQESLCLTLKPRPGQGEAILAPVRDVPTALYRAPEQHRGQLYLVASPEGKGVRYYAVPDSEGRIGPLFLERSRSSRLPRVEELDTVRHLAPEPNPHPSAGQFAGWRIVPALTVAQAPDRKRPARLERGRSRQSQWWADRRGPGNG